MSLRRRGFAIAFTRPLPAELLAGARFEVSHWQYLYRPEYGSPLQGVTKVEVVEARPAADGSSVELVLPELVAGEVYRLACDERLGLTNRVAWYTVNRLLED